MLASDAVVIAIAVADEVDIGPECSKASRSESGDLGTFGTKHVDYTVCLTDSDHGRSDLTILIDEVTKKGRRRLQRLYGGTIVDAFRGVSRVGSKLLVHLTSFGDGENAGTTYDEGYEWDTADGVFLAIDDAAALKNVKVGLAAVDASDWCAVQRALHAVSDDGSDHARELIVRKAIDAVHKKSSTAFRRRQLKEAAAAALHLRNASCGEAIASSLTLTYLFPDYPDQLTEFAQRQTDLAYYVDASGDHEKAIPWFFDTLEATGRGHFLPTTLLNLGDAFWQRDERFMASLLYEGYREALKRRDPKKKTASWISGRAWTPPKGKTPYRSFSDVPANLWTGLEFYGFASRSDKLLVQFFVDATTKFVIQRDAATKPFEFVPGQSVIVAWTPTGESYEYFKR